jgi:hypothetical protein
MAEEETQPASGDPPRSLLGSIQFLVSDDELIEPLFEDLEPELPDEGTA